MAASNAEYSIFNDEFASFQKPLQPNEDKTFSQFSRLPTEIRHAIWKYCLPPRRYLAICVADLRPVRRRKNDASMDYYTKRNALGNIISNFPYQLTVMRFKQWSRALLIVNREAYRVFRTHYRVSLPLETGSFSLLHVNPETDIVELHRDDTDGIYRFIALLHDFLAYDPRGIGITQLVMGHDMNDLGHLANTQPSELKAPAVRSLSVLLSRSIQTFYSLVPSNSDARATIGVFSGPRAPFHLNRSVPIAAQGEKGQAVYFHELERDPRPIGRDLSTIFYSVDPRRGIYLWRRFMANFGVSLDTSQMRIRCLQGILPRYKRPPVETREGFIQYLRSVDERWAKWVSDTKQPLRGTLIGEEEYCKLRSELLDVSGLWVFEADAFGDIPEEVPDRGYWPWKMTKDMTNFHPGLMVFELDDDRT